MDAELFSMTDFRSDREKSLFRMSGVSMAFLTLRSGKLSSAVRMASGNLAQCAHARHTIGDLKFIFEIADTPMELWGK